MQIPAEISFYFLSSSPKYIWTHGFIVCSRIIFFDWFLHVSTKPISFCNHLTNNMHWCSSCWNIFFFFFSFLTPEYICTHGFIVCSRIIFLIDFNMFPQKQLEFLHLTLFHSKPSQKWDAHIIGQDLIPSRGAQFFGLSLAVYWNRWEMVGKYYV